MKIAAYVQTQYSKAAYSNECLDRRQFVGLLDKLNSADKEATLKHYFDIDALFGAFTWESLPTRYLQTYARVEAACQK